MNKIEKQKMWLMILGAVMLVASIAVFAVGIGLLISGIKNVGLNGATAKNIIKIVFGIIMILLFIPGLVFGVRFLFVGSYISATKGSIKEGNIAKECGTINMKKCDKCGTEIKEGETVCSECGKPFEDKN